MQTYRKLVQIRYNKGSGTKIQKYLVEGKVIVNYKYILYVNKI